MKAETSIAIDNGQFKIERLCKYCGCLDMNVSESKGPHGYGLKCTGCDRHNGWLSKTHSQIIDDGKIDIEKIIKRRDQAQNLTIAAAQAGDMDTYRKNQKELDRYNEILENLS